jgi:hypothetical protein
MLMLEDCNQLICLRRKQGHQLIQLNSFWSCDLLGDICRQCMYSYIVKTLFKLFLACKQNVLHCAEYSKPMAAIKRFACVNVTTS